MIRFVSSMMRFASLVLSDLSSAGLDAVVRCGQHGSMSANTAKSRSTVESRLMALLQHPKMGPMTTSAHLSARLIGMGITDPCSRCCGGGYYGPAVVNGGRCFKCNGRGTQAPKLTRAREAEIRDAVAAGALEAYVTRRLEIAAAKRAAKGIWDDALDLYAQSAWYRHFNADNGRVPGYPLRSCIYDMHKAAYDVGLQLDIKIRLGRGTADDACAIVAAKAAYVESLARMDRAHALALSRGLYDQAQADHEATKAIMAGPERMDRAGIERAMHRRWIAVAERLWVEAA